MEWAMRRRTFIRTVLAGIAGSAAAATLRLPGSDSPVHAAAPQSAAAAPIRQGGSAPSLLGRLIAVGIDGASAICQIGPFHPGGPFRDNPTFAAETAPGKVLDPARLFVAS